MPTIKANGIEMYYEMSGSGEPLVFVPGLGGTTDLWAYQTAYFKDFYTTIAIDNRGAGRSEKPQGPYSMQQLAKDLNDLLDALGITAPINLVGASMGGIIAQAFIRDYPQRVKKLVLSCSGVSAGDPHYTPASNYVNSKLMNFGTTIEEKTNNLLDIFYHPEFVATHPEIREFYLNRKIESQPTYAYMAQIGACMDTRPYYQWLSDIKAPTLVIHGRDDLAWPLKNATTLMEGLDGQGKLVIMEKAAHIFMQEKPAEYNRHIRDFLTS